MKVSASTLLLASVVGRTAGQALPGFEDFIGPEGDGDAEAEGAADPDADPPAPVGQIFPELLTANENFGTLLAALEATGLGSLLGGVGVFTVFAPTDDAFGALPDGLVECLLQDENLLVLTSILQYHVVDGFLDSSAILDAEDSSLETLQGEMVNASFDEDVITVQEAEVVIPDLVATNGVAHGIDAVLVPPSVDVAVFMTASCSNMSMPYTPGMDLVPPPTETGGPAPEGSLGDDMMDNTTVPLPEAPDVTTQVSGNIASIVSQIDEFSILAGLLTQLELDAPLSGEGPFTLFAPTNAAFEKIDTTGLTDQDLKDILLFHVLPGRAVERSNMITGVYVMANGAQNNVAVTAGLGSNLQDLPVVLASGARISGESTVAANGIIHPINTVMIPPTPAPTFPPTDVRAVVGVDNQKGSKRRRRV